MEMTRLHTTHLAWLLVLVLTLAACGQVTNEAPAALEPQALILTVTREGDSGPGTLRSAISQAVSGDTIIFHPSLSGGTITLASQLVIDKNLTINGPAGGVTISGGRNVRVMQVSSDVTLNLDSLTIAKGREDGAGGILNNGNLTVTNSTFSGNSATYGGGIYNARTLNLTNSIVALNTATMSGPELWGTVTSASYNLIGDIAGSSGVTHGQNGNIVTSDPKLGPLADNGGPTRTLALLAGSPAIDAALSSSCPATDQRGVSRPQGAGCDIGAFEKEPVTVTLSVNLTGTVSRATGAVTVSGSVTCSAPASVNLSVSLLQTQGRTTVVGSQSFSAACNAPWQATVLAESGSLKNGSVAVTATEAGSDPLNQATQTVRLSWVR